MSSIFSSLISWPVTTRVAKHDDEYLSQFGRFSQYDIIVAAGFIVDGGIYRHDFVAATVLDAMMDIQLELEVPILSVVLTPHQFQETEAHENFFFEHFKIKGKEAADACAQTLANLDFAKGNTLAALFWLKGDESIRQAYSLSSK